MTLRPTRISELSEPILVRQCFVEGPDHEVHALTLSFMKPTLLNGGRIAASLRFACKYFDKTLTLAGGDDVQVLTFLLSVGRAHLEALKQDGFTAWWIEKGDLEFFDFWSYQSKPSEFCLGSAYHDAALDEFLKATEGKFLLPSHRVAIELDRPGITTYEVQSDGTDNIAGLIGPGDMKGISPDELCRRLGRMILNGSEEGRQLLAKRRESKDYPTNARSSTKSPGSALEPSFKP